MFGDALQNGVGIGLGNIPSLTSLPYSQQLRLAVASLFSSGAQGYWFDNSRLDTIFQDAAGTVPGALEAPVGKQLDLSGRGNHRSQSTSANRPTLSALVNLLTGTATLSGGTVSNVAVTPTANSGIAPDGSNTAISIVPTTANSTHTAGWMVTPTSIGSFTDVVQLKANGYNWVVIQASWGGANTYQSFNLSNGTKGATTGGAGAFTITPSANGYYKIACVHTTVSNASGAFNVWVANADSLTGYSGDGTSGVLLWHPDVRPTDQATGLIPTYQRVDTVSAGGYDTVGFPVYIKYNGSNQYLSTAAIDLTGTNKVTAFAGFRKLSDASAASVMEFGASTGSVSGTFAIFAPSTAATNIAWFSRGTSFASAVDSTIASPATRVMSGSSDISAPSMALRLNGAPDVSNTTTQGTGNFTSNPAYFGSRAGSSLWLNGYEYGNICVGSTVSAGQLAATEAYMNGLTRAY